MIAFLSVLFGFMGMLQAIPGFTALSAARSSAAALSETIDLKPAAIDVFAEMPQSEQVSPVEGRIEVDNVTFSYPARPDAPVYRNLSLLIEAGQSVALVGPSGCGKSTMVSLIERFYDVDSGKILLDGVDIQRVGVQWLRSQIGLVSQEPVLFEGSIAWNISLGFWAQGTTKASGALTEETMTSVEAAAKLSNAHSFISEFPEAYNTFVGEKGIQLSGGQKQRVAIARALARDPPILVLDEATSALDTASERLVQAALDDIRMSKKRTTIIIAHRLSTIQNADKIAVISDGAVVEEGQHSALMAREGGAYRALVESQLGGQNIARPDSLPKASEEDTPEVNRRQKSPEDVQNENTPVIEDGNAQESLGKGTKNKTSKTSMRWLWTVCWPEKWYFVLGLIGAALAGLFFPAIGFLMAEFIVVFFNVDPDEMRSESIKWCLVFCGVGVVCSAGTVLRTISSSVITERMVMRVRNMAYRSVLRQDIGWFDISSQHTAGALVSQLGNDCFLLKALTGERAFLSLSQITIIVAGLYVSFTASWRLTLVIFGIVPLIVIPVVIQAKVVAKYVEASSSSFIDAGRNVSEALLHLRTIAALGLEHERMNTFSDLLVLPYTQEVRKGIVTGIGTGVAGGTIILCAAFKYFIGGIFFDQGLVEFGDIMRCVLVLIFMAFGMSAVSKDATDKAEASVAARRIHDLLKSEPLIDPLSESGDAPTGRPVGRVEFSEVSFAYPARKDQQIYKLLSLTIEPGQTVALAGPSGCGKSTLVSLLERFYDVDAGKILLDGRDIRTLKVSWLRRQIGLVSQEPVLFSGSVAWNISLGRNPESSVIESDTDIEEAARRANAHTFIEELPQGYNTQVGERATQLSGGQKQRLAIARAIIRNPSILILDEATSALDATSEKIVQAALDELLRDSARTTIIIAHRLSTIENANKIVVFSNGAVVEEGPHKALMAKEGGMYRALVAHADQGAESSSIKKEDI
jgi:ATP-binding cassette subfamily B (MDR/TAP) protein 1